MDCDQIAAEEVGMSPVKAAKVRGFVQAVLRGQKEQQKVAAVKARITRIGERILEVLEIKGGMLEEEEKREVEEVVRASMEAVKSLNGIVQLEIIEQSLESQANSLKINL
jgi:2,3-bisphosphoglycerate-independent phosphoglycerate mutase